MKDWQVKNQIEAFALLAEIEAMKAENTERIFQGHAIAYDEQAFTDISLKLTELARNIVNYEDVLKK